MSTKNKSEIEKEFLKYLQEEQILRKLELAGFKYKKTVDECLEKNKIMLPFRFHFDLNLHKIKRISEKLHHLLINEPLAGLDLAKDIFYCALLLILKAPTFEKFDLQIIPLVINLPVTTNITDLLQRPTNRIESFQGVLTSKTTMAKYVRSSIFQCENITCDRNNWQRYSVNFGNVCPRCHCFIREDIESIDLGEEIVCQFMPLLAYRNIGQFQALTVRIKDELCYSTKFQIGKEYLVTGRLHENYFEAMNVPMLSLPVAINNDISFMEIHPDFPESIKHLIMRVRQSQFNCPWSLVIALSSQLGSHILPESSFLHLKIGLMLSLASLTEDGSPISLLAVGSDSLNIEILFRAAGKWAERCIRFSADLSCLGDTVTSVLQSDVVRQEAGQFSLGTKGVCNLGEWAKFKKEQANYICQTIESSQIALIKSKTGKTNFLNFVPLRCATWTYWSNSKMSRNHQLQLRTLINVFGIPFLGEESNEEEIIKVLWKNIRTSTKDSTIFTSSFKVSDEDMRMFFTIILSKEITLTDEATNLIRNYFVISRRERPQCLPLGAIKTITSLAEAHARLALRTEVLFEDVATIIYLYEEALSSFFGESLTPFQNSPRDHEQPIYIWMSQEMQRFCHWVKKYDLL